MKPTVTMNDYLSAIIEFAKEQGTTASLIKDMHKLRSMYFNVYKEPDKVGDFEELLHHLVHNDPHAQLTILNKLCDHLLMTHSGRRLVFTLVRDRKLHYLRTLALRWDELYLDYIGTVKLPTAPKAKPRIQGAAVPVVQGEVLPPATPAQPVTPAPSAQPPKMVAAPARDEAVAELIAPTDEDDIPADFSFEFEEPTPATPPDSALPARQRQKSPLSS